MPELMYSYTIVPDSWLTEGVNPSEMGWYEIEDDINGGGVISLSDPFPTTDTSVVPGKTYYYDSMAENQQGGSTMSEAAAVAYSTYQTYLMYRTTTSGTYAKLIDIKDYPDMIPDPNMLDATTLSHSQEIQIAGIKRMGDGYRFTANYTPTNFTAVKNLEGHQYDYALWLGGNSAGQPDGHNGKFSWTGDVRAGFPGKGVDEVQDMSITAIPSTDTTWTNGT